jgi:hypothetical protein
MEQWPADKVERRKVADLIPYARNSRLHSDAQVAQIAASIREWGWTMPILVDEVGNVIAGHGRIMAAQKLGLEDVPCMTATGWSEAKRRAYVIADNKLALNAGWDDEMLRVEFDDLRDMGFDLELTGFDIGEITGLFLEKEDGETNASDEWLGMPEFEDQDPCFRKVIVNFDTASDVQNFFDLLDQVDTGKAKSIWFPAKQRRDLEAMRWAENEQE